MSVAHLRLEPIDAPRLVDDRTSLFKEDRPRHIDHYISFFGEESTTADSSTHALVESFGDGWPDA